MGNSNVSGGVAYRRLTARPIIGRHSAQGGHVYQLIDPREQASLDTASRGQFSKALHRAVVQAPDTRSVTVEFYVKEAEFDAPKARIVRTYSRNQIKEVL